MKRPTTYASRAFFALKRSLTSPKDLSQLILLAAFASAFISTYDNADL